MDWLNYHHLHYFWLVAREGGITAAAERLRLAPPTVSAQVGVLEASLGVKLFERSGRKLVLTEQGQTAFRYAEEIFGLGRELTDVLSGRSEPAPARVMVGLADVVPKAIAWKLLEPVTQMRPAPRLICQEDKPDRLLAELAVHRLDVVLTDAPMHPAIKVRAWNHLLGECGVSFLAAPSLLTVDRAFPAVLDGLPFLLPTEGAALRRPLELWLAAQGVRPQIAAELEDSALIKVFGQHGVGAFVVPSAIAAETCAQYGVTCFGETEAVRERFYAITVERRIRHPALLAIAAAAATSLGRGRG